MSSLYKDIILDHYNYPRNFGHLKNPTKAVSLSNPLCGDKLTIEAKIVGKKIVEIAFRGEGCAISIASASLLIEKVKGRKLEEVSRFDKDTVFNLLNIPLSPSRVKCALLPLEAVYCLIKENQKGIIIKD